MADNCLQRDANGGKIIPKGRVKLPTQEQKIARERDRLGRLVRELWVSWAEKQPSPKPSWLIPYNELSEADKEADRVIGYGLFVEFNAEMTGERLEHKRLAKIAEECGAMLTDTEFGYITGCTHYPIKQREVYRYILKQLCLLDNTLPFLARVADESNHFSAEPLKRWSQDLKTTIGIALGGK